MPTGSAKIEPAGTVTRGYPATALYDEALAVA
jgi:hypothetical protein